MARPLRLEFTGALYHVTSRGDRREPIYEDDEDRLAFLSVLAHVVERFNWLVHAYCLIIIGLPDHNWGQVLCCAHVAVDSSSNCNKGNWGQVLPFALVEFSA